MDRKDFYFRELVTEGELDSAFDGAENADRAFALDSGVYQKADNTGVPLSTPDSADFNALLGGIVQGLQVSITGLVATVTAGVAYDRQGRRIVVPSNLNIDLSTTGTTGIGVGGTPSGIGSISTAPASGQFKFILLQIFYNRLLSDPRTDGNNATVYFVRDESFQFSVKASNSSASPSIPGGDAECIILGAFKRNDSNTITVQDYSTRGDWLRTFTVYSTSPLPTAQKENGTTTDSNFIQGSARPAILKLRNAVNLAGTNYANHINQSAPADKHAAKNIDFNATVAGWADAPLSAGLPTVLGGGTDSFGVQATINSIVSLLGSTTTGQGGTKKLGGASHTGSPISLAAGTARSQLQSLLDGINGHINAVTAAHAASAIDASGTTEVRPVTDVDSQLFYLEHNQKPSWPFGDGSDGDVTISVTTILTRDMYYHNLTVNTGVVLFADGYVVHVQNSLVVNGTGRIQSDSNASSYTATAGAPAVPGQGGKHNSYGTVSGGSNGGVGESIGATNGENATHSLGGAGGDGGRGSGPSNGGTIASGLNAGVESSLRLGYWYPGLIYARGTTLTSGNRKPDWFTLEGGAGGGGGAGTGSEGAGGAGGGVLIVLAANVVSLGTDGALASRGHAGGDSTSATGNWGGGGGGGGVVILYYNNKTTLPVQTSANCCPGGPPGNGSDPSGTQPATGSIGTYVQYQIGYGA